MNSLTELLHHPEANRLFHAIERDSEGLIGNDPNMVRLVREFGIDPTTLGIWWERSNPFVKAEYELAQKRPISSHLRDELIAYVTPPSELHQSEAAYYNPGQVEDLRGSISRNQDQVRSLLEQSHHLDESKNHEERSKKYKRHLHHLAWKDYELPDVSYAQGGTVMQSLQEQQLANGFGLGANPPQMQQKKKGGKINTLKFDKKSNLMPIHVSEAEIKYFNFLQHGQRIDPETGLREYSPLSKILKNPEIRNMFIHVSDVLKEEGSIPPEIKAQVEQLHQEENIDQYTQAIPSDEDPDIQKLVAASPFPHDEYIVLMPKDVINFMDQMKGSIEKDVPYHMEAFGLFNEIIRIGGTLGGALLGGPLGAGLGNALGHFVTSGKPMEAAFSGLKNYGLAGAAQGLGNLAGLNSVGGMFGGQGYGFEGTLGSKIPTSMMGNAVSNTSQTAAQQVANNASANPSLWSGMGQYLAPAAMVGAGLFMNHKNNQKQEEYRKQREQKREKEYSETRKRLGLDTPLEHKLELGELDTYKRHHKSLKRASDIFEGREHHASGDLIGRPIVGKGKGQEDLIKDDRVKEGGWIWDASTTANLGDGSTKAGHKEIEKLEKLAIKGVKDPKKFEVLDHGRKPGKVPCALSDGERYTPPHIVTLIGKGSNEKGANILRNMTKDLRIIKTSNKTELPPAAPDILHLLRKAHRNA